MPVINHGAFRIWNQLAPVAPDGSAGDPIAFRYILDFATDANIDFDLVQEVAANEIGFIQFVYISNKQASAFTLLSKGLEQDITVKPNTQGWYPVLASDPPIFRATTTPGAGILVTLFFTNVAMPAFQWSIV